MDHDNDSNNNAGRSGLCRRYCPAVTPPPRHAGEDRCHGNNSWKPWLKGQHQEDKGHENERQSPRKHQTEWRWDRGSGWFHLPWFQDVKHRRWGGGDPGSTCKSQPGLRLIQEHMESKEHSPKDQVKNLQIKCDQHSPLWIRVMEGDQNYQ